MKCPYCPSKPTMIDKYEGHNHWWECPKCHRTIGKPEEKQEEVKDEKES